MSFSYFSPITDLDNLNDTLDKYGVAVLPNVFTEDECEFVKKGVFNYLSEKHGINQPDDLEKINPIEGGIIHSYGISLIKVILDMKTDERVENIFKKIWNNEEVTMSFDGINIGVPPKLFKKSRIISPAGFHTDQCPSREGKCCVQGFINLEHSQEGDGCLSVLKNSHKLHKTFFNYSDTYPTIDWYVINEKEYDWFIQNGCEWNKILAPKGSMVFWDSRTIHKGEAPEPNRANPDRWRFVIYTCYTPRRFQSKEDTVKKRKAYIENRMTSHWPYDVNVFHKMSDDKKINNLSDLTDRHKRCMGID